MSGPISSSGVSLHSVTSSFVFTFSILLVVNLVPRMYHIPSSPFEKGIFLLSFSIYASSSERTTFHPAFWRYLTLRIFFVKLGATCVRKAILMPFVSCMSPMVPSSSQVVYSPFPTLIGMLLGLLSLRLVPSLSTFIVAPLSMSHSSWCLLVGRLVVIEQT